MKKVLYLFSTIRRGQIEKINKGEYHDIHFFSLWRIWRYGVKADYAEIEQYLPLAWCRWLRRKVLNIYLVHLPLMWKFFSYDIIFHINAFVPQLIFSTFFRKPKWVLYDFSLIGLVGQRKTLKQKILYYLLKHRTAGIITISKEEAHRLQAMFPALKDRIEFIYHGTDLEFFKPQDVLEKHQIFLVGFDPGRDYSTFLKAIEGVPIEAMVTKSHRVKTVPEEFARRTTMRNFTDFELRDEYALSKIFILPLDTKGGRNDAMGCSTLMEAMAMGKAIIATRTFTMESYIKDGENGLLVKEGSVEEMRGAILRLLEDEEFRKKLGLNARLFSEKNCEPEKVARETADFFKRI